MSPGLSAFLKHIKANQLIITHMEANHELVLFESSMHYDGGGLESYLVTHTIYGLFHL